MTNDPVLLALVDLCENLTHMPVMHEPLADSYERAMKVIRERTTPGGFTIGPNAGDKWRCTHCGAPAEDQPSIPPQK